MEILSQEQEQNQVQEPIAEQYPDMEPSQDDSYRSQMLKHLPEQILVRFQTRNSENK
jgi:hypothetical protein